MRYKVSGFEQKRKESGLENLVSFIEARSAELKEQFGIPVGSDGRIEMAAFRGVFDDVDKDEKFVEGILKDWYGKIPSAEELLERDGEKLEMLKMSVLGKHLGSDFAVVRSSNYDDIKNGVDNVIVDINTGNTVCALDEVVGRGSIFEEKKTKVLNKNIKGEGANLKYGIHLRREEGTTKLTLGSISNVPIFFLALPKELLFKGIDGFKGEEISEFERKLFTYFVSLLDSQIQELNLWKERINPSIKKKIEIFGRVLTNIKRAA